MHVLVLLVALLYGGTRKGEISSVVSTGPLKLTTDVELLNNDGKLVLRRRVAPSDGRGQLDGSGAPSRYELLELQVERRRANATLNVVGGEFEVGRSSGKVQKFQGIFGIYELPSGYFVALIKSSVAASAFPNSSGVREIKEITLLKIPEVENGKTPPPLSATQLERQKDAMDLLLSAVSRHTFYFAHIVSAGGGAGGACFFDVTRNTQSRADVERKLTPDTRNQLQWRCCDERFFWNFNLITPLIDAGLHDWVVPTTNAWAGSTSLSLGGRSFQLSLISRRSRHRQGQRYIKRGVDSSGHVANFVETEQVLECPQDGSVSSFVQVRGSIPIFWSQPETWKLRPAIVPTGPEGEVSTHAKAVRAHLLDLLRCYALNTSTLPSSDYQQQQQHHAVFLVNLVDKTGSQGRLGRIFLSALGDAETAADPAAVAAGVSESNANAKTKPLAVTRGLDWQDGTKLSTADFACTLSEPDLQDDAGTGSFAGSKLAEQFEQFGGLVAGNGRTRAKGKGLKANAKGKAMSLGARLLWFDYHTKCKKGNVLALTELYAPLRAALGGTGGYYSFRRAKATGTQSQPLIREQRRVVRTNCVDCLDRTNVVQTVLGRWVLLAQLAEAGVVSQSLLPGTGTETGTETGAAPPMALPIAAAETAFRSLWLENGDHISLLYAGTPALKRDVTRLGRRTQQGAIDDGINSAWRYYINNYKDGRSQRGLDLALGFADEEGRARPGRGFGMMRRAAAAGSGAGVAAKLSQPRAKASRKKKTGTATAAAAVSQVSEEISFSLHGQGQGEEGQQPHQDLDQLVRRVDSALAAAVGGILRAGAGAGAGAGTGTGADSGLLPVSSDSSGSEPEAKSEAVGEVEVEPAPKSETESETEPMAEAVIASASSAPAVVSLEQPLAALLEDLSSLLPSPESDSPAPMPGAKTELGKEKEKKKTASAGTVGGTTPKDRAKSKTRNAAKSASKATHKPATKVSSTVAAHASNRGKHPLKTAPKADTRAVSDDTGRGHGDGEGDGEGEGEADGQAQVVHKGPSPGLLRELLVLDKSTMVLLLTPFFFYFWGILMRRWFKG